MEISRCRSRTRRLAFSQMPSVVLHATGGAYRMNLPTKLDPIFLGMPGRYLNEFGQPMQGALGSDKGRLFGGEPEEPMALSSWVLPAGLWGGTLAGYADDWDFRPINLRSKIPSVPANDLGIRGTSSTLSNFEKRSI